MHTIPPSHQSSLNRAGGLLSLLVLSSLLAGCAFSTDKIPLEYHVRGAREKVAGADGVQVQVTITDDRKVKNLVGRKFSHGGIASTTDVAELVRSSIESELSLRGFSKGNAVLVSCDLTEFWNEFKQGFWAGDSLASVKFTVQVKKTDGTVMFTKNVVGNGKEANIQVAAGHNAQPALEQAFSAAIEDLFSDPAFTASLLKAAGANPP